METSRHLYQVVYESILKSIRGGVYQPGDRLPTEGELAQQFEVSRITAKKAMNMLVEDGLIFRRPGLGSFVQPEAPAGRAPAPESGGPDQPRGLIGLIMEDFSSSYGIELLRSLERESSQRGYDLCVKRSLGDQSAEERAIHQLLRRKVDGIIVMPTHGDHYNTEILRLVVDGFPVVLVDRPLKGIPASYVGTDNRGAASALTEYLLRRGHRRLAMVTAPAGDAQSLGDRIDGFLGALKASGDKPERQNLLDTIRSTIPSGNGEGDAGGDVEKIELFLSARREITAVLAAEYGIALLVRAACRNIGVRIPEDISLVCFDSPENDGCEPFFTHMRQSERQIGEWAVRLLADQVESQQADFSPHVMELPAELAEGLSVRSIK